MTSAPPLAATDIDHQCITALRTLAMDAVQAARSGHPGAPMGMAPIMYALWNGHLRYDPADPTWPNRDRFVLSAGHASTLLYGILHIAGVRALGQDDVVSEEPALTIDDLKAFRQLDSRCPGHPEYGLTSGVECTTGPLGTGFATSVGMAIAAQWQAATFNRANYSLFDYNVYALGGDGCMMEGIASEAASLAGHLGLANLCWIYDSNRITIEGTTELTFTEDVATRFMGYGWNVTRVADANDLTMLDRAFEAFGRERDRPTLVIVDSHIAYGAPTKQDSPSAHGEPLGDEEIAATKRFYGSPENERFRVPAAVYEHFATRFGARGRDSRTSWGALFGQYRTEHPELADAVRLMQRQELPDGWDRDIPMFPADEKGKATRETSGLVLNAIAARIPWLLGGSSDLAPSTKTRLTFDGAGDFSRSDRSGRNLHFGVREHAAGAVANGLALSKVRPFQSGFLVFSDFQRGALRLSALMELPVIHVYTHDSIGVGEDGPTHQPVEHLASLRAMPGLVDLRPGDANEVAEAWRSIMTLGLGPVALVLSRQPLPTLDRSPGHGTAPAAGVARGGYILRDAPDGSPDVILIASGSELSLAVEAGSALEHAGVRVRVVSLPSWELFARQDGAYRDSVLPPTVTARVAVEQGSSFGWERFIGAEGSVVAMDTFGASAPLEHLQQHYGFTTQTIVNTALRAMGRTVD